MMINFTVICLQPNCGDYQAQVNYTLNMKFTISCLNTCFRMRKINKRISKLLQETNLQVLRQPHRHPFSQTVLYIISVSTTIVSTTGNTVKTISKYQLFSNATRKQWKPNSTFTSMLNNDFSSNPIMPADLFKRPRENDKS